MTAGRVPDVLALRRELHSRPELSLEEHATAERIERWLTMLGLRSRRIARTGVTASVKGRKRGRTILARADTDALPVSEETGLRFASRTAGVMHACGHDFHMAGLVEVARRLVLDPPERGTAKLLFQPGEEGAGGMQMCIDGGVLARPAVDAAVGVHVWQPLRVGKIALVRGPAMAGIDRFDVVIEGRGGHAARPHEAVDPVLIAAHVVTSLQSIVARNVDPQESAVLTVGLLQAGTASNVIPRSAVFSGTVRTFSERVRKRVEQRFRRLVADVCRAHGARARIDYAKFLPPVVNDPGMVDLAWAVAEEVVGRRNVLGGPPTMASEDMGLALAAVPGVFGFVGGNDGTRRTSHPHHSPGFCIDEGALAIGAAFVEGVVRSYLSAG